MLKTSLFVVTTSKIHINHVMLKFFVVFACFPPNRDIIQPIIMATERNKSFPGRFPRNIRLFFGIALSDSEISKIPSGDSSGDKSKSYEVGSIPKLDNISKDGTLSPTHL